MSALVAVGVLVSIVASLAHEALGHGLGCVADGGHITLITFLVFRCAGAGALADGGGPIGAILVGCAALASTRLFRSQASIARLFLLNLGAISLLWACAQAVKEAVDGSDDWGHLAKDLAWSSHWHWMLGVAGVFGYALTLRVAGRLATAAAGGRPLRLLLPYAAATLSAVVLGALWHGDRLASALDGFLCFGVAPAGYWLIARRLSQGNSTSDLVGRSAEFLAGVGAIWLVFACTVARGLGSLS